MTSGCSRGFARTTKRCDGNSEGGRLRNALRTPSPRSLASNRHKGKDDSRPHGQSPIRCGGSPLREQDQLLEPLIVAVRASAADDAVLVDLARIVDLSLNRESLIQHRLLSGNKTLYRRIGAFGLLVDVGHRPQLVCNDGPTQASDQNAETKQRDNNTHNLRNCERLQDIAYA